MMIRGILAVALFAALTTMAQKRKVTLQAGDAPPKLSVSKWIGGEPIAEFAEGTIYVVDCWATWCGPCIASMPHMSALNTRYKEQDVVFVGLNVDDEGTQADVPRFIEKRLSKDLNFVVGLDTFDKSVKKMGGSMAWNDWLIASGNDGIPTTFLIGKDKTINWIGHPMELDEVLQAVLAGTFDVAAHAEQQRREKKMMARLQKAFKAGDWDKALTGLDALMAIQPVHKKGMFASEKFNVLLRAKKDYKAAYALAESLLTGVLADDAESLNAISYGIITDKGIKERDYDLALKMAMRADALTDHASPFVLDTLAFAYMKKGDAEKAIELQTLAIEKAEDEEMKRELQKTLDSFKSKR